MRGRAVFACAAAKEGRCVLKEASDRGLERHVLLGEGLGGLLCSLDTRKVFLAGRLRVIGVVNAKECPSRAFSRLQYPALRLQNCTSTLMLQPNARQTRSEGKRDLVCVPVGRPEQLQCVCCETGRTVEAAVSRPRMPVILSHVLTAHHNWPEARMRWDHMVDILRGIGLVVHDEAARAKPKVLDEDRVAGDNGAARVFDIDAPEPESFRRMKP